MKSQLRRLSEFSLGVVLLVEYTFLPADTSLVEG